MKLLIFILVVAAVSAVPDWKWVDDDESDDVQLNDLQDSKKGKQEFCSRDGGCTKSQYKAYKIKALKEDNYTVETCREKCKEKSNCKFIILSIEGKNEGRCYLMKKKANKCNGDTDDLVMYPVEPCPPTCGKIRQGTCTSEQYEKFELGLAGKGMTESSCREACDKKKAAGCEVFILRSTDGKCYLFKKKAEHCKSTEDILIRTIYSRHQCPAFCGRHGGCFSHQYYASKIKNFGGKHTVATCRDHCTKHPQCKVFALKISGDDKGKCYLMSKEAKACDANKDDFVMYPVTSCAPFCGRHGGCSEAQYNASKIKNIEGKNTEANCRDKCSAEPRCKVFVLKTDGEDAGKCFLMNKKAENCNAEKEFQMFPAATCEPFCGRQGGCSIAQYYAATIKNFKGKHTEATCRDHCAKEPKCEVFVLKTEGSDAGKCYLMNEKARACNAEKKEFTMYPAHPCPKWSKEAIENDLWDGQCTVYEQAEKYTLTGCKEKCTQLNGCNAIAYCAENCQFKQCYLYTCALPVPQAKPAQYKGYTGYSLTQVDDHAPGLFYCKFEKQMESFGPMWKQKCTRVSH